MKTKRKYGVLVDHENYGEAIMGIAFTKVLQKKEPNFEAILPKAQEVAAWIYEHSTDEEKQDIRAAGFLAQ
jgi:hypothetical protein